MPQTARDRNRHGAAIRAEVHIMVQSLRPRGLCPSEQSSSRHGVEIMVPIHPALGFGAAKTPSQSTCVQNPCCNKLPAVVHAETFIATSKICCTAEHNQRNQRRLRYKPSISTFLT